MPLQTIPVELYEAARLDGAGTLATFRFVTLPMLIPAMVGALILRVRGQWQSVYGHLFGPSKEVADVLGSILSTSTIGS